ncbi:MAG: enoyl-CoA hydratase-related protein [Proteobacteria bacterium]|nr:enoyl-CoA hydratase-related protein [Pseudomonadota bacterium]
MPYEDIAFDLADGVATLALNRPEHLNTFSGKMGVELADAYRRCDADDAIRAVVVTGVGRAFCAGADMSAGENTFAPQDEASFSAAAMEPPAWEVRKPIIAAMNGHAIGIGFTLALQCDIRIAALDHKYGVVQVRRGMMPDGYAHWTLPRLVGMSRAAELLLTGRRVLGEELERMGIASRALPPDEVLPAALEIAEDIAHHASPLSVGITKKLLWESSALSPEQVEHRETALHHHLMGGPDAIEGVMAYVEKRRPSWQLSVGKNWPDWPSDEE